MALNPSTASEAITSAYLDAASLNADGSPNLDESGQPVPPEGDFPADWAQGYDVYAAAGEVPGADNSGRSPGILESVLRDGMSTQGPSVTDLAQALAEYWATVAVEPGSPAHGGVSVVSVENDAIAQVAAFESAIQASITQEERTPYFLEFVSNVESIGVGAVTWSVSEQMPDGTVQVFPEVIS